MYFILPNIPVSNQNIQFGDKKKNMIIDGQFSKIVYASHYFVSNGIFLHCRILVKPPGLDGRIRLHDHTNPDFSLKAFADILNRWDNRQGENVLPVYPYKSVYKFDPNLDDNRDTVVQLCIMEEQVLEYYKTMRNIQKTNVYNLKSSLLNGNIKIHDEMDMSVYKHPNEYILKISGVWETNMNVGLTFKFMYIRDLI
jgi:hypothetical protein